MGKSEEAFDDLAAGAEKEEGASEGASSHQIENTTTKDNLLTRITTRNPWMKRRRNKWLGCVGITVIILAILLPIVFIFIYPAIAQSMLNSAGIPISSIILSHPTPGNLRLSLDASIKLPTPLSVRTDPIPLDLYVNDGTSNIVPYTNVTLPATQIHGKTPLTLANQLAVIQNQDEFAKFVHDLIFSETFTMSVTGNSNVYLGKLKASVKLNKDLSLLGLDSMKTFSIPSGHLVIPAESDGTNLLADLSIPNPSVFVIPLGNLTYNVLVGGVYLGPAYMKDVTLHPGANVIPARGVLSIKTLLKNLKPILASGALAGGNIELEAVGNASTYDGVHIPYLEKATRELVLRTKVPLLSLLDGALNPSALSKMKSDPSLDESTISDLTSYLAG